MTTCPTLLPAGRRSRHTGAWLSLCLAPALLHTGCAQADERATLTARVDTLLATRVAAHEFSGAVVLTRNGTVLYERGVGMANRAESTAFTPDTPADGGSMAKTFTAAGIWWLVADGRIDPEAPVRRYLPAYPHATTTVRQLIAHSNGLPADYERFEPHFGKDQLHTTEAMLAVVSRLFPTPMFAPGTRFEYSNLGYDVAATLIERVSEQSYEDFLRDRFFTRLGMTASFVRPARFADWTGVRTLGYRWKDSAWTLFDVFDKEAFRGGSNIYFSARDLSRWASAHAAGTAIPAAVSAAGRAAPVIGGAPSAISGLNWYCDATGTRCYYTGDLNAFFSFVYWDRTRNESIVYLSNSSLPQWQRPQLARDLIDALSGTPKQAPRVMAFAKLDSAQQRNAAGTYVATGLDSIVISTTASGLRLQIGAGLEYDMFRVADDALYVPGLDVWAGFTGVPRASELHLRSVFRDAVGERIRSVR